MAQQMNHTKQVSVRIAVQSVSELPHSECMRKWCHSLWLDQCQCFQWHLESNQDTLIVLFTFYHAAVDLKVQINEIQRPFTKEGHTVEVKQNSHGFKQDSLFSFHIQKKDQRKGFQQVEDGDPCFCIRRCHAH